MRRKLFIYTVLQLACLVVFAVAPQPAFADSEEDDDVEAEETGQQGSQEGMVDEVVLVEISGVMEGYISELNSIASAIPKSKNAKIAMLNQKLTSVNVRWDAYSKLTEAEISQSEVLLELVSQFKSMSQAVADSLAKQKERADALVNFEKFEKALPSFTKKYDKLYKQATEFSLIPQTAQQLARVKTEEQLLTQDLDAQFAEAKNAAQLVPQLKGQMHKVNEKYMSLKEKSEAIQAAEYKPLIERVKDYILTFAGVAIILMFINMVQSKKKEMKAAREAAKQYKEMMMKNNNEIPTICLVMFAMLLTACESRVKNVMTPESDGMEITSVKVSDDCRTLELRARINGETEQADLADSSLYNIEVKEFRKNLIPCSKEVYPKFVSIKSIGAEQVWKRGLVMHVLIDLTQPVKVMSQQREMVKTIKKLFCHDNLFLTFMLSEGKISPTMAATDYVINNYISPQSPLRSSIYDKDGEVQPPYVYASVSEMLDRLSADNDTVSSTANYKLLMLFTDGEVYDEDDYPFDPNHFAMQERLIRQARSLPENISVFYLDLIANEDNEINENNMLRMVCQNTNGKSLSSVNPAVLDDLILSTFNIEYDDYIITLRNPEEKYYFGDTRYVNVIFKNMNDSLVASAFGKYSITDRLPA